MPSRRLEPGVKDDNDNTPRISKMQIDLMVNSFAADFARVATLQYSNSVGGIRMRWLGISEGHHELSHKLDDDQPAQVSLTKINQWFCEQMAYLAKRLPKRPNRVAAAACSTTRSSSGPTSWAKAIPTRSITSRSFWSAAAWVSAWDGCSSIPKVAHNRLHLALAHAMGHHIDRFGNPDFCGKGPLSNLT